MKLLLVYPSTFCQEFRISSMNQQLFYLYSYLRHRAPEVEVEILDLTAEWGSPTTADGVETFLREARILLARTGFDMVGISCWSTWNYPSSVEIARLCKELNPEAPVIVGGYHPTFAPQDFCFPGTPFDYVVQSEGEKALLDIVQGLVPKEAHPQIIQGVPLPMTEHVLYWGEDKYHRTHKYLPVWLSRGCPFACAFCADRLTTYRTLSPAAAMAEIRRMIAAYPEVTTIMFYDPLFGIQREWRREFLQLLREADFPVNYWAETRVDLLAAEDIEVIADMRFRLDLGLESVVPEMLAIMQKTTDPKRYLERCWEMDELMNRRRVPHIFNHIYNHPGETTATLQQSLAFWEEYFAKAPGDCYTYVGVNRFRLNPGSEVYINWPRYVERYGCHIVELEWWKQTDYPLEISSADVTPSRELAEARQLNLSQTITDRITNLAYKSVNHRAFRRFLVVPPNDWTTQAVTSFRRDRYFDDKPLVLSPRSCTYETEADGKLVLHGYYSETTYTCTPQETGCLKAILAGRTLADLDPPPAPAAPGADPRDELRYLLTNLLGADILRVGFRPPEAGGPAGRLRVRLRTWSGDLEIELYPDAAPRAVASVLALLRGRYYDSLTFFSIWPSRFIQIGTYTWFGLGPGYNLPLEPNDLPVRRGALSLVRMGGNHLHGGLLRLHRTDAPDPEAQVIGQVVAGWEALDSILNNDYLVEAVVLGDAPAPALVEAFSSPFPLVGEGRGGGDRP